MTFNCVFSRSFNKIDLSNDLVNKYESFDLDNSEIEPSYDNSNFIQKLLIPKKVKVKVDDNSNNNLNELADLVSFKNSNTNNNVNSEDLANADNMENFKRSSRNFKLQSLLNNKIKRGFQIQTYYDALVQNDGSILLIPKDVNKNHYFIG